MEIGEYTSEEDEDQVVQDGIADGAQPIKQKLVVRVHKFFLQALSEERVVIVTVSYRLSYSLLF